MTISQNPDELQAEKPQIGAPYTTLETEFILEFMRFLRPSAIQVYLALCAHTNRRRQCWPSKARLAEVCGLSVQGVEKALQELIENDLILRASRFGTNGRQQSNAYAIVTFADARGFYEWKDTDPGGEPKDPIPAPIRARPRGPSHHRMNGPQEKKGGAPPVSGGGPTGVGPELASGEPASVGKEKGKNPTDSHPKRNCQAMVEIYHEHCPSLPPVVEITPARRRIALARLKDLGGLLTSWEAFCDHVEASDWLTGRAEGSAWRADWDWIMNKTNYLRIMEGRYADRETKDSTQIDEYNELTRKILAGDFDDPPGHDRRDEVQ